MSLCLNILGWDGFWPCWRYWRAVSHTVNVVCVDVCVAERPGVPVSGSLAAAGKLKCHDWLPAALGPTLSVAGWLLI